MTDDDDNDEKSIFSQRAVRACDAIHYQLGGLVVSWLGRRTRDKKDANSTPGRALLGYGDHLNGYL